MQTRPPLTSRIAILVVASVAAMGLVLGVADTAAASGSTCRNQPATIVSGDAVIYGTSGPDVIVGDDSAQVIYGLEGDDIICGMGGDDVIYGGLGADILSGGNGADELRGSYGPDTLFGGYGADSLHGASGADELYGGPGSDQIDGGSEGDVLDGGSGDDCIAGDPELDDWDLDTRIADPEANSTTAVDAHDPVTQLCDAATASDGELIPDLRDWIVGFW